MERYMYTCLHYTRIWNTTLVSSRDSYSLLACFHKLNSSALHRSGPFSGAVGPVYSRVVLTWLTAVQYTRYLDVTYTIWIHLCPGQRCASVGLLAHDRRVPKQWYVRQPSMESFHPTTSPNTLGDEIGQRRKIPGILVAIVWQFDNAVSLTLSVRVSLWAHVWRLLPDKYQPRGH